MTTIDVDPAALHDRLVAEGAIDPPPSPTTARKRRVDTPVVAHAGRSHPLPEDVYAALLDAGSIDPPPPVPLPTDAPHPADLVEWAITYWWPGYAARWDLELGDPGDLEAGVAELALRLSIGDPETTPKAASDRVRAYTYEAVFALLAGEHLPVPGDEPENRLQILRGITNQAAEAAYAACVGTLMPVAAGGFDDQKPAPALSPDTALVPEMAEAPVPA